jgi:hypothetical protein
VCTQFSGSLSYKLCLWETIWHLQRYRVHVLTRLELKVLDFTKFTAWTTGDTICFKPERKVLAHNTYLWITRCVLGTFGITAFNKSRRPVCDPKLGAAPSVHTSHRFFHSMQCSSKEELGYRFKNFIIVRKTMQTRRRAKVATSTDLSRCMVQQTTCTILIAYLW